MPADRGYLTIGGVVEKLSDDYADLTVSKVRFLEEEGLIAPERTAGGYRKFTPADVARLEFVLKLQREHFLPLAVIREKLRDLDRGKMPEELRPVAESVEAVALPFEDAETVSVERAPDEIGIPTEFIDELTEFGLVETVGGEGEGPQLTRADVEVAHVCWDLRRYGIEPRHLRMFDAFAEREASLLSQVLVPGVRHRTPEARQEALRTLSELTDLIEQLKRRLLTRALHALIEDVT